MCLGGFAGGRRLGVPRGLFVGGPALQGGAADPAGAEGFKGGALPTGGGQDSEASEDEDEDQDEAVEDGEVEDGEDEEMVIGGAVWDGLVQRVSVEPAEAAAPEEAS